MKRRSLTVLLCLLAIISLASVGFASWVISADGEEQVEGNISVETVADKRVIISNLVKNPDPANFIFGQPQVSPGNAAEDWLVAESVATEQLTLTITFDIANKALPSGTEVTTTNTSITVGFEAYTGEEESKVKFDFSEAVAKGYIEKVPEANVSIANNKVTITIEFKWGQLFNYQNPFNFYNSKDINKTFKVDDNGFASESGKDMTYGDHAAKYMLEMYKFFNDAANVNYVVIIKATQPAHQG